MANNIFLSSAGCAFEAKVFKEKKIRKSIIIFL